ncbi:MAG TPA: hypothetical protein GX706_00095, partial [Candidatus Moranbacteria bacterium]|nr:hypothetical protein [Candidatus Moranbacteria bacterium]
DLDGNLKVNQLQAETVVAGEKQVDEVVEMGTVRGQILQGDRLKLSSGVSGQSQIISGETEALIEDVNLTETSKVSLTAKGSSQGKVLYVDKIDIKNKTFTVKFDGSALDESIDFYWFIVD